MTTEFSFPFTQLNFLVLNKNKSLHIENLLCTIIMKNVTQIKI